MEGFDANVREWVAADNEVRCLQTQLTAARVRRRDAQGAVLQQVETQKLGDATVKISDGTLSFTPTVTRGQLTFRHVRECLERCIGNEEAVCTIIDHIKESRPEQQSVAIRRVYTTDT